MNKRSIETRYVHRPPRPSRLWQWLLRPLCRWVYRDVYGVKRLEIRGESHVREATSATHGVMLAFNHPAHGDPFMVVEAMNRLGVPCCYLAAWQVLAGWLGLKAFIFQRIGAFTIDREGTDMRAFRTSVDVLADGPRSLVIFPEGDVYHLQDRLTPLREGAAMIALTAARRRRRNDAASLSIVPCGIRYEYLGDPTPSLEASMARLEADLHWRPPIDRSLDDRVYAFAEAILSLKEQEYMGTRGSGSLPERIAALTEAVLRPIEQQRLGRESGEQVAVRVKAIRQAILRELFGEGEELPAKIELTESDQNDLDDLQLVTQLVSYPGDYIADTPSLNRIAETIDKFEEDLLGVHEAGRRTDRRCVLSFGPPIDVGVLAADRKAARCAAGTITTALEKAIQHELDTPL